MIDEALKPSGANADNIAEASKAAAGGGGEIGATITAKAQQAVADSLAGGGAIELRADLVANSAALAHV